MSILSMKVDNIIRHLLAETPGEKESTLDILRELLSADPSKVAPIPDNEATIRSLLLHLGVPSHVLGYNYLVTAIAICATDPNAINAMHKGLYPKVARIHNATPPQVERTIRHAIELAWERGDMDILTQFFGNTISPTKGKTTNSEFIARLADVIREQV